MTTQGDPFKSRKGFFSGKKVKNSVAKIEKEPPELNFSILRAFACKYTRMLETGEAFDGDDGLLRCKISLGKTRAHFCCCRRRANVLSWLS